MNDATISTVLVAFFACLPPTIVALAALLSSWSNAKKTDRVANKVDAVHVLTNSNLSAVTSALQVANEKISGLEKLMANMTTAKQDAQEEATSKPQKL